MGSVNAIPVVSQIKSAIQALSGQVGAAEQTQQDFIRECILISQCTSLVQFCLGDPAASKATQRQFLSNVWNVADSFPLVGVLKGLCHAIAGQTEFMIASFKAQGRTAACIFGGLIGMWIGPIGALIGGVLGGVSIDVLYSLVCKQLHGICASISRIFHLNRGDDIAGAVVDALFGLIADALAGCSAAGIFDTIRIRALGTRYHAHPSQYSHGEFVSPFRSLDHNVNHVNEYAEHMHPKHQHHHNHDE